MVDFLSDEKIYAEIEKEFESVKNQLSEVSAPKWTAYAKFDFTPRNSLELKVFKDECVEIMKESFVDREWLIARLKTNPSELGILPITYIKSEVNDKKLLQGSEVYKVGVNIGIFWYHAPCVVGQMLILIIFIYICPYRPNFSNLRLRTIRT